MAKSKELEWTENIEQQIIRAPSIRREGIEYEIHVDRPPNDCRLYVTHTNYSIARGGSVPYLKKCAEAWEATCS